MVILTHFTNDHLTWVQFMKWPAYNWVVSLNFLIYRLRHKIASLISIRSPLKTANEIIFICRLCRPFPNSTVHFFQQNLFTIVSIYLSANGLAIITIICFLKNWTEVSIERKCFKCLYCAGTEWGTVHLNEKVFVSYILINMEHVDNNEELMDIVLVYKKELLVSMLQICQQALAT